MVPRLTGVTIAAGMALSLASCGGSATTSSSSGGASESISLEAQNYQFSPTTLTLPANATVNLTVKNTGTVHHNFTVKELGVNKDVETPGKSETVTFTTKGNATYTFYCEYHRDSNGMKGTLTVGTGAAAGAAPAPATSSAASSSPSPSRVPYP